MSGPITVDEDPEATIHPPTRRSPVGGPVVMEVRGLQKSFRVPKHRVDSLKERVSHPFTRIQYRELRALRQISFEVHKGEFFGIVGRNGSGKSTLLKILAGIYSADAGRIRVAGRVAPFIELGVGLNPELTARENTVVNGVMMGLSRRQAARRLDAVLEFAGLREFVELKLKNYSSGMLVRLAFAVMVQADADIMLIDEVLAVGDAEFAQKCMDVFQEKRNAGKTIVLVTHDMGTVQSLCHRAMLLQDGELQHIGDPEETAIQYYRLNFEGPAVEAEKAVVLDINARLIRARLMTEAGESTENLEQGSPIVLDILFEARRALEGPIFVLHVVNVDGVVVFGVTRKLGGEEDVHVAPGAKIAVGGRLENSLVPGRYYVDCWVRQDGKGRDMALQALRLFEFVVFGTAPRHGVVTPRGDLTARLAQDADA
ncbi:MAG: ABC transporter ATP-binding protein [Solirubrobacteraceae bacterium]